MAISATFRADFAQFVDAVNKAEIKLKEFQTDAGKVGQALNKMTDSFSGRKVITEAQLAVRAVSEIGGATKLTEAEQKRLNATLTEAIAKYKAIGDTAPKEMLQLEAATRKAADSTVSFAARMEGLRTSLNSFAAGARSVGVGLTAALTVPITAVGAAAIKLGIDAVESENLIKVSFGNMKGAADDWAANLSKNLGLNRFETEKMAATLFNMTTSMGIAKDAAFDMSTGVVQLAADMASFRNIPMEEALNKITAGLTGEAEPLKRIGILVNEATVKTYAYTAGIAKQGEELTEQQKVLARYGSILQQTANDQGDLARTLDSPANQLRIMKERVTEAGTALGVSLIPLIRDAVSVLSSLVPHIQRAVEWFTKLPEPLRLAAVGVAAIAAGVGPVVYVLGTLAAAVSNLIPLYVKLAGSSTLVGTSSVTAAAGVTTMGTASTASAAGVTTLGRAMLFLQNSMIPIAALFAGILAASKFLREEHDKLSETERKHVASQTAYGQSSLYLNDALRQQAKAAKDAAPSVEELAARTAHLNREAAKTQEDLAALAIHLNTTASATQAAASATQAAAPAVATYSAQLAKAKAELAGLSAEQLQNIASAKALGNTTTEISKALGISEGALKLYEARLQSSKTATTNLAAETKKFLDLTEAESLKGWTKELERIDVLAQKDRQALYDMNLELERQADAVRDLKLANADAAANVYLQQELELWQLQTVAAKDYQKTVSQINNENALRQMAKDAGVAVEELTGKTRASGEAWGEVGKRITSVFGTVQTAIQGSFAQMLLGAKSFKDGFLDIWQSIKAGIGNIFTQLLGDFTNRFLKGLLGAVTGQQGAFQQAFAGLFSGGGGIPGVPGGGNVLTGLLSKIPGLGGLAGGGAAAAGGAFTTINAAGLPVTAGLAGAGGIGGGGTAGAVAGGIGLGSTIALTGGIAGAALLAYGIVKKGLFRGGEEALKVNPARDAFFQQFQNKFGGDQFSSLAKAFAEKGISGDIAESLIAQLYKADTMKEFEVATKAIEESLASGAIPATEAMTIATDAATVASDELTTTLDGVAPSVQVLTVALGEFGAQVSALQDQLATATPSAGGAPAVEFSADTSGALQDATALAEEWQSVAQEAENASSAVVEGAVEMSAALVDVQDDVNAVSYGSSPGGLKDIPILIGQAVESAQTMAAQFAAHFSTARASVDDLSQLSIGQLETMLTALHEQLADLTFDNVDPEAVSKVTSQIQILSEALAQAKEQGQNILDPSIQQQIDQLTSSIANAREEAGQPIDLALGGVLGAGQGFGRSSLVLNGREQGLTQAEGRVSDEATAPKISFGDIYINAAGATDPQAVREATAMGVLDAIERGGRVFGKFRRLAGQAQA